MPTHRNRSREARPHRTVARVNAAVFAGYIITATTAVALKAWETIRACDPDGWLGTTNAVIWDAITLYGALGALALGVREMVLAYFMRRDYEAEMDTMRRDHAAEIARIKAQARAEADRDAIREQNAVILRLLEQNQQMMEQNRQMMEQNRQLLEQNQRRNGNGSAAPAVDPASSESEPAASGTEPSDQPEE